MSGTTQERMPRSRTTAPTAAAPPTVRPSPPAEQPLAIGHGAVLNAIERNTVRVVVPALGAVELPSTDTLAWLAGLATIAALGVLEWPVAAVIGVGHVLAHQHHLRLLKDFGEGLQET